ncbi:MAG: hypothetical protein M3X11_10145 [Acidobacteriota bacterium]|nr:hypothetical protein [Acidobacteriota bacterium]
MRSDAAPALDVRKTADNCAQRGEAPILFYPEGGDSARTPEQLVKVATIRAETRIHRLAHLPQRGSAAIEQGKRPGSIEAIAGDRPATKVRREGVTLVVGNHHPNKRPSAY